MVSTNEIWEDFKEPLKRFIAGRVQDEYDAEDILQEIFFKIYNHIGCLKEESKLRAWVFQIARNAVIDYYRLQKTKTQLPIVSENIIDEPAAIINTNQDIIPCLQSMINYLPEKYRQAILLSEFEGLTQKEMAEKLGLSLSGVKSRIQRARKELKGILLECCQFEFDRLGNILDYRHKRNDCPHCTAV
ncbi:MAG: RNA polymerase sigma factor SigZ [Desulfotomaculaceae bacterium]